MITTKNLPMKRMNAPTQLIMATRTRLAMRRPNTFLQEEQKADPLNAGEERVTRVRMILEQRRAGWKTITFLVGQKMAKLILLLELEVSVCIVGGYYRCKCRRFC